MKKLLIKILGPIVIVLLVASLSVLPSTYAAEQMTDKEQVLTFIEKALPVDLSKYNIAFEKQSTLELPSGPQNTVQYILSSEESTFTVRCRIQNNVLISCHVSEKNGSIFSDKQYDSLLDAVKSFLEKYQIYSKIDSTSLIQMLDNVYLTKNMTSVNDNNKLVISSAVSAGDELIFLNWAYMINEVNYTSLQVGFQKNGILHSLYDTRALYTIGDTTVNVSSEQAIDIAMNYLPSYSYEMPDHTFVNDFNITEDKTTTELVTYPIDSLKLRPYWVVKLYLNQTYPGSVQGFTIYVWANSGELFLCTNIAHGGIDYDGHSDVEVTASPGLTSSTSSMQTAESALPSAENSLGSINTSFVVGLALVVLVIVITSMAVLKRRKK